MSDYYKSLITDEEVVAALIQDNKNRELGPLAPPKPRIRPNLNFFQRTVSNLIAVNRRIDKTAKQNLCNAPKQTEIAKENNVSSNSMKRKKKEQRKSAKKQRSSPNVVETIVLSSGSSSSNDSDSSSSSSSPVWSSSSSSSGLSSSSSSSCSDDAKGKSKTMVLDEVVTISDSEESC